MPITENIVLDKIRQTVKQIDPFATAILYGSRATGKANAGSDWDILILLNQDNVTLKDEQKFRHNLYDVEVDTGELISTLVYGKNDWDTRLAFTPLHNAVSKTGIKL